MAAQVAAPDTIEYFMIEAFVIGQEIAAQPMIRVLDGKLVTANGSLAGAYIDLKSSVARLISLVGVPTSEALASTTTCLRAFMGIEQQEIVGSRLEELFFASDCPRGRAPSKHLGAGLVL